MFTQQDWNMARGHCELEQQIPRARAMVVTALIVCFALAGLLIDTAASALWDLFY